ncbi:hypothetical protein DMENIID0001_070670 [Sergentomyia squamirostris]
MQVATLFRESAATLLGNPGSNMIDSSPTQFTNNSQQNQSQQSPNNSMKANFQPPAIDTKYSNQTPYTCLDISAHHYITPTHDVAGNKILSPKLKCEMPSDDGYETSGGDMMTPRNPMAPMLPTTNNYVAGPPTEDPYNFIDDDLSQTMTFPPLYPSYGHHHHHHGVTMMDTMQVASAVLTPKKRGRKRIVRDDEDPAMAAVKPEKVKGVRERKKHDRFNGMPEEEVSKRTLPDHLDNNLDIIIIGINPGLFAAYKGHHYAGPGNHLWKCLYLSGLTHQQMAAEEDYKLLKFGIGFTNMVERATKGSADLTRKEIKEGCRVLLDKLRRFRPKIAVFNGKLIFEVFSGKKDFSFGRQPDCIEGTNTYMWVMPSSSARCAQLPRAADKVPFYAALKKFRDYLNGVTTEMDLEEQEFVFSDPKFNKKQSSLGCESVTQTDNSTSEGAHQGAPVDGGELMMGGETKKKRGRPKKVRAGEEGAAPPKAPTLKRTSTDDGTKKKRGRPKKVKDQGSVAPPTMDEASGSMEKFSSPPPVMEPIYKTPIDYQSPQNSQQFSDLSSEISAAISSDHLADSPPATSPPLGPPDFEPPATMPTNDVRHTPEMNRYSPYCSYQGAQEQQQQQQVVAQANGGWRGIEEQQHKEVYKVQDVAAKSLSGLESLVDQIPSMRTAGDNGALVDMDPNQQHQQREEDHTNYSSCLYGAGSAEREYESLFTPYSTYPALHESLDALQPPTYEYTTSNLFSSSSYTTYPPPQQGFAPQPQHHLHHHQMHMPNPNNYLSYTTSSPSYPSYHQHHHQLQAPPPMDANRHHHLYKPDITGYNGF